MLSNNLAEAVADLRAAVIPVGRLGRDLFRFAGGLRWLGERPDLLDRADADAVGLAQGAIDGSGLGDSHFSPVNQCGNIGGVGIAIADETTTAG